MIFRKVIASKYIGPNGYSIRKVKDGSFSVFLNNRITTWGTDFISVKAASAFIDKHDVVNATNSFLPMSSDDVEFIVQFYGFDRLSEGLFKSGDIKLKIKENSNDCIELTVSDKRDRVTSSSIDDILQFLDDRFEDDDIFSAVLFRGIELRSIFASRDRRSSRQITQNLIRVKSSNVWAYGVEIKDNNAKVGDVYVQFKGKNGGAGDIYKYFDVPLATWRKFISYPSKGAFVHKYLRNNFYYSKLTGDKKGKLSNAIN